MKLLSFISNGKALFGAVSGDAVVTMNERVGHATLRDALAAGAIEKMREIASGREARSQARRDKIPAGNSATRQNPLRRHQLPRTRRRDRPRIAESPCHVRPLRRHAGWPRRRDDPPACFPRVRFRGRTCHRHRPAGPPHQRRTGIRPCRRLYLLCRRQRPRLIRNSPSPSGKNFPGTGPLGPWIVTADEIPDPAQLMLTTQT